MNDDQNGISSSFLLESHYPKCRTRSQPGTAASLIVVEHWTKGFRRAFRREEMSSAPILS